MTTEQLPVPEQGPLQPENREELLASADRLRLGSEAGSVRTTPMLHVDPLRQLRPCPVTEPPPCPRIEP
jgi:hypothetical protein